MKCKFCDSSCLIKRIDGGFMGCEEVIEYYICDRCRKRQPDESGTEPVKNATK